MSLVKAVDIAMSYPGQTHPAVNSISFDVARGEVFAILGPSGSGKTSTLRLLAGFERLSAGSITLAGREVASPRNHIPPDRRNVGFVFQEFALFPHLTVMANVMFGLRSRPSRERRELAQQIIERAQLEEHADKLPRELSGGQQQRVALARAMAPRPDVILLDEPFGSLDPELRADARAKVGDVIHDRTMTAVMVTHDQQEALDFADRIAVMRAGRIEQIGTPEELYASPQTQFVAAFIGGANILEGTANGNTAETAIGAIPVTSPCHGPVTIALRPEHVQLTSGGDGVVGRVVGRHFHGHDVSLQVRLNNTTLTVWDDYRCTIEIDSDVVVTVREPGIVVSQD